jgi:long-chain acyl-CoA synthetase
LSSTFDAKSLLLVGCTGFLGKIVLAMLLECVPSVRTLYVVLRVGPGSDPNQRLWTEVLASGAFGSLRRKLGEQFEPTLRRRLVAIAGDVGRPLLGIAPDERARLQGRVAAIVNVAGIVDFDPPLDQALEVNAQGVCHIVALARELGAVPVLHTSTCFVAGERQGVVEEVDPRQEPFARGVSGGQHSGWSLDGELQTCLRLVEAELARVTEGHYRRELERDARLSLATDGELPEGTALELAVERARRRLGRRLLVDAGMRRARALGFPNTYTYTKALGEQVVARSGLPFAIVRPAIVESCEHYPCRGWNEGSNTSAPLIYLLREGALQIPGSEHALDVIPGDHVAAGLILALAELLDGTAAPVYQLGTSDTNRCSMRRFFELSGLYKRRYYREGRGQGRWWLRGLQAHFEGAMVGRASYERWGPPAAAQWSQNLGQLLQLGGEHWPEGPLRSWASAVLGFSRRQKRLARVLGAFVPFTADYDYVFRCDRVRAARARLSAEDAAILPWGAKPFDWAEWFDNSHAVGLERWVFPELEAKLRRKGRPAVPAPFIDGLARAARSGGHGPSLLMSQGEREYCLSPTQWLQRISGVAKRLLESGVGRGDGVWLGRLSGDELAVIVPGLWSVGARAIVGQRPREPHWSIGAELLSPSRPEDKGTLSLVGLLSPIAGAEPSPVGPEVVAIELRGAQGSLFLGHGELMAWAGCLASSFAPAAGDALMLPRARVTIGSLLWLVLGLERRCLLLSGGDTVETQLFGSLVDAASEALAPLGAVRRAADRRPWHWTLPLSGACPPGLRLRVLAEAQADRQRLWGPTELSSDWDARGAELLGRGSRLRVRGS